MSGLNSKKITELYEEPYIIIRDSIIDLLDDIQSFETNMVLFNKDFGNPFSYEIAIKEDNEIYTATLKIIVNKC